EYGIIAEAILEPQEGGFFIRDLAVSCRTLGRGIGGAMLVAVLNYAKSQGVKKLTGYIKETEANWRLRPLFEKRNFHEAKKEDGKIFYDFFFDKDEIVPYPPHLTVELENEKTN
ncbi:MAG: GNAT family N-acetyltransferase, partial [archaeon]|nr:GNAT family N-acetyltransferase [archaeon]